MSANMVIEHSDTIMYKNTSGSTIAAGRMFTVNDKSVAIMKADLANNAEGAAFHRGIFKYARLTGGGTAWVVGDPVFYDKDNNRLTKLPGLNDVYAGLAHRAAADGDAEGEVVLNQRAIAAATANVGASPTATEFNNFLDTLRNAGVIQKGT